VEKNTTRQVSKFVNAKEVWDKFIDSAWTAAEPGCLFWDTAIKKTPSDIYSDEGYSSLSTNPCVTGDTWVHAGKVIRQVKDLIGDSQGQNKYLWEKMIVDGKPYNVTSNGFFSNGVKKVFQLETNEGFKLKLTADHKLMLADGSWAEVQSIREGEKIRLHDHREYSEWQGITGSDDQGYVLGMLVGDGTFSSQGACVDAWEEDSGSEKNIIRKISNFAMQLPHRSDFKGFYECSLPSGMSKFRLQTAAITDLAALYGIVRGNKVVTTRVEQGSPAFYKGFLRGFFDADGSVQGNQSKGCSIKLTQINLENLEAVQRMLLRLGIFSTIYKRKEAGRKMMPDGKGGMKEYPYEDLYELIITSNHLVRFADMVGFEHTEKMHKLNTIIANYKRAVNTKEFLATFKSLTYIGEEEVFDITVDNVHAFDANGFYAHNCGEIVLSKNDSCRLITMNSSTYVTKPFTKEAGFDYDLFATDAGKAQRLMDDLVDLEIELVDKIIAKVQNDPEPDHIKQIEINLWQDVRKAAINGRRTGLGITAIGDTVAALGLRYGSPESIKVVEEIYKALALGAYRSSVQMAKERGAFPIFSHEKEKGHEFLEQIWAADPVLYAEYQRYGRRNIALTTTAPTGSVSTMTQTTSGIEPVFMTHYKRRKKINPNDKDARVDFVDQLGDKWQEYTVYHHGVQRWMDVTGENDIAKSPYHGATANEIDWEAAVDLQAAAQKWICHAISKTTNLPNSATKEDVDKVYRRGWKTGCKGITVYRDGCRSGVLVAVDAKENDKKETLDGRPTEIKQTHAPRRPDSLPCEIHHVSIKGTKWVILVGLMGGKPYEMFAGAADSLVLPSKLKAGEIRKVKNGAYSLHVPTGEEDEIVVKNIVTTFDNAESAWATRMISMSLRHGVDVEFIVTQLSKDGAITDINKVLSRVLKKYIDNDKSPMTKCKDCGSSNVMFAEGCLTCKDCGSSKC
jgi:ribonucleotide reductase alpha subunit